MAVSRKIGENLRKDVRRPKTLRSTGFSNEKNPPTTTKGRKIAHGKSQGPGQTNEVDTARVPFARTLVSGGKGPAWEDGKNKLEKIPLAENGYTEKSGRW